MIERSAVAGLNHLLAQQRWAAERLAPFVGQRVEFHCPPLPGLRLKILDTGFVEGTKDAAAGALMVKLKLGGLPLLLARGDAALKQVEIEGSAELANAVQFLFRHLDWDIEEDLSRLLGDVLAHRLASAGRAFAAWQREAATRLAENLAEYWTEEQPLLARRADAAKFCAGVAALREDVTQLEKRLEKFEAARRR
jgi:ubiquinone biosynthesis protein UbiJ